jgi:hypothetical protein
MLDDAYRRGFQPSGTLFYLKLNDNSRLNKMLLVDEIVGVEEHILVA